MKNLQREILEEFASFNCADYELEQSFEYHARQLVKQRVWDEAARVRRATDPVRKLKFKAQQTKYEKKRWQLTKDSAKARLASNAKRMAAYARLKADPVRWAAAKAKQAVHAANHKARVKQLTQRQRKLLQELHDEEQQKWAEHALGR